MNPFQQRVVLEASDLEEKIIKLKLFIDGTVYTSLDEYERERLRRQLEYMEGYFNILLERIKNFEVKY